jgi:hypothetical protein
MGQSDNTGRGKRMGALAGTGMTTNSAHRAASQKRVVERKTHTQREREREREREKGRERERERALKARRR